MNYRDFYFERFKEEPTDFNIFNRLLQRGSLLSASRFLLGIGYEDYTVITEKEFEEFILQENRKELLNEIHD